jgi:hypothetical protein
VTPGYHVAEQKHITNIQNPELRTLTNINRKAIFSPKSHEAHINFAMTVVRACTSYCSYKDHTHASFVVLNISIEHL